jgi:hypothetical protein
MVKFEAGPPIKYVKEYLLKRKENQILKKGWKKRQRNKTEKEKERFM